ncbi:hypothetical protein PRIPAC_82877 [Pristionchus pacificus]|uniref:Uncharacterized protein n=1 Tax=Pristionchus pacificus TaxID=54126 RepID=A0A2A6CLD5_PRIPA|nr:hypothetical protein PRIPAC_82877 [Pristionchus pacificus]|eukprot:PDM78898.1 hypothetical protein PRIPAC_31477 [Pristionchus pacificus]
MDLTKFIAFVSSMAIALPVYYLATRCVIVLKRLRYWRNPFCKIFIVTLILNLIIYALLAIHLYMPGLGWLGGYCIKSAVYITFILYAIDILINIVVFYKFIKARKDRWTSSSLELSLHIYSFAMFFAGLLCCGAQFGLRYGPTDTDVQLFLHTFSNVSMNLLLLSPTVFILAFTSEIRRQVITCCYMRSRHFEVNPVI